MEERSLILWTLPVKQQQSRVQMRTEVKVMFVMKNFCVFCCHEGQLSVIQCSTLRTINSPRALEHAAADAKWLSMEMF